MNELRCVSTRRMISLTVCVLLCPAGLLKLSAADGDQLLAPPLPWFDTWMDETQEPVPNFAEMRSMPGLPPLLQLEDGRTVETKAQWHQRREEIKQLLCHWIIGSFPEDVPSLSQAEELESVTERGAVRKRVELTFDCPEKVSFTIELMIPEGSGPFPVFMTQTTHRRVGLLGLSRGYMVCIYPGADSNDQTEGFRKAYPEADWGRLARRAWLGSRALDYIQTLPDADMSKVAITGHSRNGKQSLIAAAYDDRIDAVVSSSSGTGGAAPFRFVGENAFAESVEFMSRQEGTWDWFHPRIRLFTGREHKLPIDMHGLTALIAPRDCLFSVGLNDGVATTFAVERNYLASRKVYRFLDQPESLRIRYRPSTHEWDTETAQSYFDWFDRAFGLGARTFPEVLLHEFDFSHWKQQQRPSDLTPPEVSAAGSNQNRQALIEWALGDAPAMGVTRGGRYGKERPHVSLRIGRDYNGQGVTRLPLNFGEYVPGDFYFADGAKAPLPVVIYLHPFTYSKGTVGEYVRGERIYHTLARQGYGVLAFDQLGFGHRLLEGSHFYDRYPRWSRLGKMIRDVRFAVDALLDGEGRFAGQRHPSEQLDWPEIDPKQIYVVGYALGGQVGLYAAAMDDRIAGVVSYAGFTPLRTDTDEKHTGGIRRWWQWHALQPKLGLYDGCEQAIPYDYDDVLRLIAPRPCLVVAPVYDRAADLEEVVSCVNEARDAWQEAGSPEHLDLLTPAEYSMFEDTQHARVLDWLEKHVDR